MHPLGQQPSAAAQAATAALARQGSVRKGSRAQQPIASSPSQSSLSHHSFTQHGADRMQQHDSFNPQWQEELESAQYGRATSHSITQQVPVRPSMTHTMAFSPDAESGYGASVSPPHYSPLQQQTHNSVGHSHTAPSPFFGRSAAFEEQQQRPSEGTSGGMGRIDPTPLLTSPAAGGGSGGSGHPLASLSSTPSLFSSSDPYRPVRRWLFDFPASLNSFFSRFDDAVCKLVQTPLATVGGADVCLEEEILESDAYATQSRRAAEERRRRKEGKAGFARGSTNHDNSSVDGSNDEHSASGSTHSRSASRASSQSSGTTTVLQKSLAITWSNKVMVAAALTYTALTTIELGVVCPLFLFLIGLDQLATLALFSTLCAGLISQLFKRFLWRPRPWMQGRAIQVKRDLTSSFPSRAVICAVVYSFIFSHVFLHHVPPEVYLPIVFVFAMGAAVSRIFVGAHFASDCLFGFVLGVLICVLGDLLNHAVEYACGSCGFEDRGACYAWSFEQRLTASRLSSIDVASLLSVTFVSLALVGLAMSSPLQFWTKVLPVFGPLAPCLAFRLVNLCPRHNEDGVALLKMRLPSAGVIVLCALISLAALVFCKGVNKLIVIERPSQLTTEHDDDEQHGAGAGDDTHSSRRSMQCSSWRTTVWNLSIFLFVFAAIFIGLTAWRIHATPEDF